MLLVLWVWSPSSLLHCGLVESSKGAQVRRPQWCSAVLAALAHSPPSLAPCLCQPSLCPCKCRNLPPLWMCDIVHRPWVWQTCIQGPFLLPVESWSLPETQISHQIG